jgi:hypothetical protein
MKEMSTLWGKRKIQWQNIIIKMFESFLIKINIFMSEHLVYEKTMTSWWTFSWWWNVKIISNLALGVLVGFLNPLILLSNMKVMTFQSHNLKYILTMCLPLVTHVLLPHVNNSQVYPIWFAQNSHLYSWATC